jgi:cardiolipin synthase
MKPMFKKAHDLGPGVAALALTLLVGCRSLPTLVPDMRWAPREPVALEGAHGPLTAAQSKAILDKLKANGLETSIFDRHLALETAIVGSPLVVGNAVEILVDGPTTYAAMFKAMEHARQVINVETFTFENDAVGKKFVALLAERQRHGVQVNVVYDSVGSLETPKAFFEGLKKAGGHIVEFNPINPLKLHKGWAVNRRDHRKLLIVDGEVAFVGGINISSVYSKGSLSGQKKDEKPKLPWRDTHLRMSGPIVSEFEKLFLATWTEQKGEALAPRATPANLGPKGKAIVRAIGSAPGESFCLMYSTLLSAIDSAESQVFLTNAYFVPDPQLRAALKRAVARGVDVRLLLPGTSDSIFVAYASHSYFDELLKAGVKIYEHQGAFLHAKTAVIDGVWSTIGSTNLDWRSFVSNQEINAVILGQEFGARMQDLYEKDLAESKPVLLPKWKQRSVVVKAKERAARLWARFL